MIERWAIEAIAAAGLAVAGYGLWIHHDHVQQALGAKAVSEAVQQASDTLERDALAKREQQGKVNAGIVSALQDSLSGAADRNNRLVARLRTAQALDSSQGGQDAGHQSGADATCSVPTSDPEIERLAGEVRSREAEAFTAAESDSARLTSLQNELRPQL